MWTYLQDLGKIFKDDPSTNVGFGWAGNGDGKNNPAMQDWANVGPLPQGFYTIEAPHDSPRTGPYTLNLTPAPENQMFGRADFRLHGAAKVNPELSSDGCIVMPRPMREAIWNSGDHLLQVLTQDQLAVK